LEVVQQTPVAHSANRTLAAVVSSVNPTTKPRPLQRLVPTTHPRTPAAVSLVVVQLEVSGRTTKLRLKTQTLEACLAVVVVVDSARTTTTNRSRVDSLAAQALVPQVAASLVVKQTRASRLLAGCLAVLLPTTPTTLEVACSVKSLLLAVCLAVLLLTTRTLDQLAEACSVASVTTTTSKTQEVVAYSVVARTTTNKSLAVCLVALRRTRTLEVVSSVADLDSRTTTNQAWAVLSSRSNNNRSSRTLTTAYSVLREALC
jgi:hypothetical protein